MLQVKDLVKRYTTKGETVVALDHVSVDFPEKGMVFLLGKSGSGKSTLLNVAGGLDSPDEGEVVVKGKSSKDFTPSDFDSYRNTYVGFIFQEYNILTELTVAENVALALELQGKPKDPERIAALLEEVDLGGFGDRKPNTLSGGQKQRVAIARALVKNPEIIMGDEPTGALDSATGKQVFDTLKKLSAEKLVVIVSHDRDFAEVYADRIIELKDGHIVSDVTREGEIVREAKNLSEVSEKKLTLTSGTALSEEEEAQVVAFLKRNKGTVVISAEEEDVKNLPVDLGPRFSFAPTKPTAAAPEKDESAFIKSRFPMRYAFKMGVSGLLAKPVRLVFTTLLATIAFIVFGVFSTLITYKESKVAATTLIDSSYEAAVLEKHAVAHCKNGENEYTTAYGTGNGDWAHFSEEEIGTLREKYPALGLVPVFNLELGELPYWYNSQNRQATGFGVDYEYYGTIDSFAGFTEVSYAKQYPEKFDLVAGEWPKSADECVVSAKVFETYTYFGHTQSESPVTSYDDLIGLPIALANTLNSKGTMRLTITGIFDPHESFDDYEYIKEGSAAASAQQSEWREMKSRFAEAFRYSFSSLCVVDETFYAAYRPDSYEDRVLSWTSRSIAQIAEYLVDTNYLQHNEDGTLATTWNEFGGPWRIPSYRLNEEAEKTGSYITALYSAFTDRTAVSKAVMELDSALFPETDIDYEAPYSFMSGIRASMEDFDKIIAILGSAAAVLAVFAALLLFNFISASINAKRKDIGILRAVGARGIDIFKIFIVEGIAITLFCFALGSLGAWVACTAANAIMIKAGVLEFGIFFFDYLNALIVLAIAFATSVVAVTVPVSLTAKRKPVEAIRAV